jgi:hypothetical protein
VGLRSFAVGDCFVCTLADRTWNSGRSTSASEHAVPRPLGVLFAHPATVTANHTRQVLRHSFSSVDVKALSESEIFGEG